MTIPIWAISLFILIVYIAISIHVLCETFYILSENDVGVLSASPLVWSLIIASGWVVSGLLFKLIVLDCILLRGEDIKTNKYKFPRITRPCVQECYVATLENIWGITNDGIRKRMHDHWLKVYGR
jgi:hypothetical protein